MAFRRIDPMTVADEFGNTMWLPELGVPQPMGDGVTGSPVPLSGPPGPADFTWPALPEAQPPMVQHPDAGPPDMTDPRNALMNPEPVHQANPFPNEVRPQRQWDANGQELGAVPQDPYRSAPAATPQGAPQSTPNQPAMDPEAQAMDESRLAAEDAARAQFAAARELGDQQVAAAESSVSAWDQQNQQNQQRYELAAQKADQETADWLKENQAAASAKADPSRYWNSRSGFSQAMWLMSLIASSVAVGYGKSENITLKMLDDEIERDINLQREEISRRLEASRAKGSAIDRKQAREFSRLADNESAGWQRWSTIERVANAKAALPGPEAKKAALAQVAAHASEKKAELVEKRATRAHEDWRLKTEQDLEREKHAATIRQQQAALWEQRQARIADDKRQDRQQLIGVAQFEEDRLDKYNLAAVKAAGAGAAGGIEPKDQRVIDKSTGFRIRYKDGREEDIVVPKEQHKEVAERVEGISQELSALGDLRKAVKASDWSGRTFRTDGEFVAAVENMAGPRVKLLNKGATTEADIARSYKSFLGYDPNSVISTVKGPSPEEMLSHLDKQIDVAVRRAPQAIRTHGGIKIPDGADVVFTPRQDLNIKDPVKLSAEDALATGGVTTAPAARPQSVEDVRKARGLEQDTGKAGVGLPPLPPELGAELEKFTNLAGKSTPRNVAELAENAKVAVNAWAAKNPDPAAAQDARVRIEAAAEDLIARNREALEVVRAQLTVYGGDAKKAKSEIRTLATRAGLDLTAAEIADLAREAEARAKMLKGLK